MSSPRVVVFDVNETLSDLSPMGRRFSDVGAPAGLRDVPVHDDVPAGVRALRAAGLRLVTLTNGSTDATHRLLTTAGLRDGFERLLSVEDAGMWKPAARAYAYAARCCDVALGDMILVAVHPWDIDGAARAGMRTAWINRDGRPYPAYFTAPSHEVTTLPDLAERLE